MNQKTTKENVSRKLIQFTVPLILSGLLQQIFNWVDALIVGHVEGELALAGIGATGSLYNLFVAVLIGATTGISIMVGQKYGSGKKNEIRGIMTSYLVLLGILFLMIAILGICFAKPVLVLMDTPQKILEIARGYLTCILPGVPFLAVYNTYASVLRGIGDSRASFISVMVCSGVNVILDILFVVVMRRGAVGAAQATALSQMGMTVFLIVYTFRKYEFLRFEKKMKWVDSGILKSGMKFILPPAIQSGVSSVGNLALQRFMNSFGEMTVAAISTAYRVDTVIMLPIVNFGSGIATMVAQSIGAGDKKQARKILKSGLGMISIASVCLSVLVVFGGEYLVGMFGLSAGSIAIGKEFFRCLGVFYIFFGLDMAMRGYLEGRGDMLYSGVMGIMALGVRIVSSYLLVGFFDNRVIAYAEAISWIVLLLVLLGRYQWKFKQDREKIQQMEV